MSLMTSAKSLAAGLILFTLSPYALSEPGKDATAELGRALFFDTNLSLNRNQSCSSCHDAARAFSDSRDNGVAGAVSLGDDKTSLGDRNAPATTYAALIPNFHREESGEYKGGFFLDGRAPTMIDQAMEPFLNPLEMAMPDGSAVVNRIRENPSYVTMFERAFGDSIFSDSTRAFKAVAQSLSDYENTAIFRPFDSKYDRHLLGEYEMTHEEELGRILFFSQLVNCHKCHLQDPREFVASEPFSNYRYNNIGVPVNSRVRAKNGLDENHTDPGLLNNPRVTERSQMGKFRVPGLRNVAVTGPYMHNGVFLELETAIIFYNRFALKNPESQINPEADRPWGAPEVPETVDLDLLQNGQPLTGQQVSALAAFLRTLTDRRYEHLLDQ